MEVKMKIQPDTVRFDEIQPGHMFVLPDSPEVLRMKRWNGPDAARHNSQGVGEFGNNHTVAIGKDRQVIPVKSITVCFE